DVVAPVLVRRNGDRAQPDGVYAEPLEIVQALDDAAEVADAVTVGVGERADIDLVQDPALPPGSAAGRHAQRYRVAAGSSSPARPPRGTRRAAVPRRPGVGLGRSWRRRLLGDDQSPSRAARGAAARTAVLDA